VQKARIMVSAAALLVRVVGMQIIDMLHIF
jgi:hypothetical protein